MTAGREERASGGIDWAAVRHRLEEVSGATAASGSRSEADARSLLEARARQLARRPAEAADRAEIEVVTFLRGRARYALESRYIQEVFPLRHLALLPGVPEPVVGAVVWKGEILVLLEVRPGAEDLAGDAVVVAIGTERAEFGLVADSAGEVARIPADSVAAPADGVAAGMSALLGVTAAGVLVLDGAELIRMHTRRSDL
ncbi:MAG: chemotaxis protein CheW [Gemmatimonadetes bacterium]|nr:chemotaxis protein CheW [Gemmatimonadota bacterium]